MPVNSLPTAASGCQHGHTKPRDFLAGGCQRLPRFPLLPKKISYRGQSVRLGVDTMSHTQPEYDFVRKAGKSRFDTNRPF
jgi:hypothetical protein